MAKISCIICAYNEETRIAAVLSALENHPLIDEVLVVDDGSADRTSEVVRTYANVRLISYPVNKGKSYAVTMGIREAAHELLMFLDADLVGLTSENITALAEPVLSGEADVAMSLRKNSLWFYKLIGLDYVSGERMFPKTLLLSHLEAIAKLPGFGIETYMNQLIVEQRLTIRVVRWDNVINTRKSTKMGFWKGTRAEIHMVLHILKIIPLREIIRQIVMMRSLAGRPRR